MGNIRDEDSTREEGIIRLIILQSSIVFHPESGMKKISIFPLNFSSDFFKILNSIKCSMLQNSTTYCLLSLILCFRPKEPEVFFQLVCPSLCMSSHPCKFFM